MRLLILLIFLSGCSIFKSTVTEKDTSTQTLERRDVATEIFENIEIAIPPDLFIRIYNPLPDGTVIQDTTQKQSEPVTITINRTEKTQDNTSVETETKVEEKEETIEKTESKGLFGFGGGFLIAMGLVLAGAIYLAYKFLI